MHSVSFLSALLLLAACSSSPTPAASSGGGAEPTQAVSGDDTLTVALGGTASTRDRKLRLTFVELAADSRCAANVVCVWEGDAAVKLRVETGTNVAETTIHTRLEPKVLEIGGFSLSLLEVRPYPGTTTTPQTPTVVVRASRT